MSSFSSLLHMSLWHREVSHLYSFHFHCQVAVYFLFFFFFFFYSIFLLLDHDTDYYYRLSFKNMSRFFITIKLTPAILPKPMKRIPYSVSKTNQRFHHIPMRRKFSTFMLIWHIVIKILFFFFYSSFSFFLFVFSAQFSFNQVKRNHLLQYADFGCNNVTRFGIDSFISGAFMPHAIESS